MIFSKNYQALDSAYLYYMLIGDYLFIFNEELYSFNRL